MSRSARKRRPSLELVMRGGIAFVEELKKLNKRVFLDIEHKVKALGVIVGEQATDLGPVSLAAFAGVFHGVGDERGLLGLRHGYGLSSSKELAR